LEFVGVNEILRRRRPLDRKTDVKATMQHKYGVGIERQPLPKGDGGPLPGPEMPGEK
jgi:hypothetical protein